MWDLQLGAVMSEATECHRLLQRTAEVGFEVFYNTELSK